MNTILALFRDYKPLTFFGSAGLLLLLMALLAGLAVLLEFIKRGSLARPMLSLVVLILFLCGLLSVSVGLVLHSIARRSQEFEYQIQLLGDEFRAHSRRTVDE